MLFSYGIAGPRPFHPPSTAPSPPPAARRQHSPAKSAKIAQAETLAGLWVARHGFRFSMSCVSSFGCMKTCAGAEPPPPTDAEAVAKQHQTELFIGTSACPFHYKSLTTRSRAAHSFPFRNDILFPLTTRQSTCASSATAGRPLLHGRGTPSPACVSTACVSRARHVFAASVARHT